MPWLLVSGDPLLLTWLTLIQAWIICHTSHEVWNEIINPIPKLKYCRHNQLNHTLEWCPLLVLTKVYSHYNCSSSKLYLYLWLPHIHVLSCIQQVIACMKWLCISDTGFQGVYRETLHLSSMQWFVQIKYMLDIVCNYVVPFYLSTKIFCLKFA